MTDHFPRSGPILERWHAAGHEPTHEEKQDYWHAFAQDSYDALGTDKVRIRHVLGRAAWAWALAEKSSTALADLERRLAAMEQQQQRSLADAFRGPWLPATAYQRGDLVQHGGSAWLALEDGNGRPGECSAWRLLVKGGR